MSAEEQPAKPKNFFPERLRGLYRKILKVTGRKGSITKSHDHLPLGAGKFILRIPRELDAPEGPTIENDKAALLFAAKLISVPVPDVLRVENGRDNPIDSWYVV